MESILTTVDEQGIIHLEGLPPHAHVRIIVETTTVAERKAQLDALFVNVRATHPFMHMSKEEILARLRQTREEVWQEQYGHLSRRRV